MNNEELYSPKYLDIWNIIEGAYSDICAIWNDMGLHSKETREEIKEKYINSCRDTIKEFTNKLIEEEDSVRQSMIHSLQEKKGQINHLCDVLGYEASGIWLDANGSDRLENKTLRQQEVIIDEILKEMNIKYTKQYVLCQELFTQLKQLYFDLGEELEKEFSNLEDYLTENGILDLQNRINEATRCKESRIVATRRFVDQLLPLYESLGISNENAVDEFDKIILTNPNNPPLARKYLQLYPQRINNLQDLRSERITIIDGYTTQIEALWNILQTPKDEIDKYVASYPSTLSNDAIAFQQHYLAELQQDVQMKLKELIPSLREEIYGIIDYISNYATTLQTWDLSILSLPEDQFTMDVFNKHNTLYEQLKEAKGKLDPIVNLINEREHIQELKKELDTLMKDPTRYTDRRNSNKYLNRQRALEKEIRRTPIIINELIPLVGEYELHYGEIIINGKNYLNTLKEEEETLKPRSTLLSVHPRLTCRR